MNSTNSLGATQVTLQFDLSRNIDAAAQDVQAAITQAAPLLPPGMPSPPTYRKVNPADQPIIYLGLTSATLPLWTLDEYGETLMAQRISMVSGVAQVQVFGATEVRRARASRSARRWPAAASASTRWSRRCAPPTSTCRPARCTAAHRALHGAGDRPAHRRRRLPAGHRRLSQRRAGAPRPAWGR